MIEEYITKEYFEKTLDQKFDQKLKNFATKEDFELLRNDFKQHTTDLKTGFNESILGIGDYVKSLDEKITRIDERVVSMDLKLTNIQGNIVFIKDELRVKTNKKDTEKLERRVIHLEHKFA